MGLAQRGAATLGRYWHTIRHLEPVQIYGRLLHQFARPSLRPHGTPVPRPAPQAWVAPVSKRQRMLGPSTFRFLNRTGDCLTGESWNGSQGDRLWLYNLHYFDDLTAERWRERTSWHLALVERWIAENPPVLGVGWESYPLSVRVVNWIKWAWQGTVRPDQFDQSLALQCRWLTQRIERHLLGNHLISNARALVFGGAYFQGPEAGDWLHRGVGLLDRELVAQVLPDGAHCERSPMYHAVVLEDLLDVLNLASSLPGLVHEEIVTRWRRIAARMLAWLGSVTHPDGEIAFFNDAALGIAATHADLVAYGISLGLRGDGTGTEPLQSGYARLVAGDAIVLADVAAIGPDSQPGHAHADTLSYELSLGLHRLFVNSGTSTYAAGPVRAFQRSTAAHNTVEIDRSDSSEVWGAFRVARRARPFDVVLHRDGSAVRLSSAHDGYRRLAGRPVHRREWCLEQRGLRIVDRIEGSYRQAVARHYMHPDVTVDGDALKLADGRRCRWRVAGGRAVLREAQWFPEFGVAIPNACIEIELDGPVATFELTW